MEILFLLLPSGFHCFHIACLLDGLSDPEFAGSQGKEQLLREWSIHAMYGVRRCFEGYDVRLTPDRNPAALGSFYDVW
ncbi:hypothetical protein N656DRAFT_782259 [Canariomyces notabilis]|uniref:Uncharacterized protein n=1 Tax=Canariomyces notabilis TaxID=2074819 RepID=A0AAN6QGS4_9PEZI|nr:hypothetical protein N656DRAFT_782259 [Canariomyces arenarius]